jgi:tripartite-type tricarboxylate transporter receptor subunit TctC
VQEKLAAVGTVPVISTPEQLGQIAKSETRKWASVVKEAKVTLQ